uniref:Zgc:154093 n=1 Tax=Gouania willdenowi TaxID=441366 RepID=A0A8C5DVS2_GOUWI
MPAKTPIYLKTTTPKKGKKLKLRDVLSGDMISPPLGDVRHRAHVGPEGEGDMFGDVSFLQGKMDMLPSQNGRSHSAERREDDGAAKHEQHTYTYNGRHYQQSSSGLLKNTISMPVVIAHEQAPPKPPRLHLEDPSPTATTPTLDISISPAIRRLVPSSGSFSEVSSEDSLSESCCPLDPRRGLSLDSDAGLSNEDLRSEHNESPCAPFHPRSDSMVGLDLDLGPSILEDVLGIMDRNIFPSFLI